MYKIVLSGVACASLLFVAGTGTPAAAAVPAANCPVAKQPFSLDTSLHELFVRPRAKAAVDRVAPGFLDKLAPAITGTELPALSAIITVGMVSSNMNVTQRAKIAEALRAVPVTAEDIRIRCDHYDGGSRPLLPAVTHHPAILVFEKSSGFRDVPSVDAAAAALRRMGAEKGWQIVFTERASVFNRDDLRHFDAVVWNNVSGDVLALDQRAAFRKYVEQGGGFAGVHGTDGDPLQIWGWFVDTLIGARFGGHPDSPQFQNAKVTVDDTASSITAGLPPSWTMREEWYSFRTNPRTAGAHILATLDETTYKPSEQMRDLHMGDHPIAWNHCVGNGRSFYTAIGHLPSSYTQSEAARLLTQGIGWAAKADGNICRDHVGAQ